MDAVFRGGGFVSNFGRLQCVEWWLEQGTSKEGLCQRAAITKDSQHPSHGGTEDHGGTTNILFLAEKTTTASIFGSSSFCVGNKTAKTKGSIWGYSSVCSWLLDFYSFCLFFCACERLAVGGFSVSPCSP
jgi:hypothetical protein